MITLALAQMVYFISLQSPYTGGEDGIQAVPRGRFLGLVDLSDDRALYVLVAAVFLAGIAIIHRIIHSPFGQVLKAIRDNEPRAISLGYSSERYKLIVFTLSASSAGPRGRDQGARLPARLSHRRALGDVGRGRPDDARRRPRHRLRTHRSAPSSSSPWRPISLPSALG